MRPTEVILQEKLEQGKSLEYVKVLATAINRPDLKELVEKMQRIRKAA
jgi:hypothetical protein